MRLTGLAWLWLALASNGLCQGNLSFQFEPYLGPTLVYPDTVVNFELFASGASQYEPLMTPTNATVYTGGLERPGGIYTAVSWHTPPISAIGTTNIFSVRAVSVDSSSLMATCTVSFVVIDLPRIRSIVVSNDVTVLQFTNPFANPGQGFVEGQGFIIERADATVSTNWSFLNYVVSSSPIIQFTDTNPPTAQKFYRLAVNGWCYGFDVCP